MPTNKQKIDENDFTALDRVAHAITRKKLRPMSPAMRQRVSRSQFLANAALRELRLAG